MVLESQHVEVTESIPEDPEMKRLADECEEKVGAAMDQIIGASAVDLDCRFTSIRTRETNIGNFIADVMRAGSKADVAFVNSGALRADAIIPKGSLRLRDLLSILPMMDELCLLEISGEHLVAILHNSVSQYPRLEGRFLQVSGLSFTFDPNVSSDRRVVESSVLVGGKPISGIAKYRVCTLNYLRKGKDGFDLLKSAMCLADGEQAGVLPTLVRDHFNTLAALNGWQNADAYRVQRAARVLNDGGIEKMGEGPSLLQNYGIRPEVEGRIVCLDS